ncbi:MAG: hypothetical protein OQL19_11725 [Gammaproteobacteria bacterium]|nr:hypothetical protein [Gammaproteobacteria bacterium]
MRSIIGKGWRSIGETLVKTAQSKMKEPKHGKVYIIDGKAHTASAPNEAPAILSGKLFKSVGSELEGNDLLFGAGNDKTDYAKFLELGTEKMENRPFIFKSVEDNFKEIEVEFGNQFKGL